MPRVSFEHITKTYGLLKVLDDLNLAIDDGDFLVLLGPSGCGKTTLLNLLAGLLDVTDGRIMIGERDVTDLDPKDRGLAMVFQSYALYPTKTVHGNLKFGLSASKLPREEIEKRIAWAAKLLQIEPLLNRKPGQLSGGQRQRVAIGRALVKNVGVFLFDEPLSNLDAKLRGQMRAEIKALQQRLGTTTVYVTHDQTEAMTMADKIVVLRDGKVEQIGAPMDIYNDPVNHFVAGFIGSPPMNFLRGEVTESGIAFPDGRTIAMQMAPLAAGRKVDMGIRPKHFLIDHGGRPDAVPFTVDLVEPTGDEMELRGKMLGQTVSLVAPARNIRAGDRLDLVVPVQSAFLFDAETGERLRPSQMQ
jgi:multiple sugar transport system ATP-binding protein